MPHEEAVEHRLRGIDAGVASRVLRVVEREAGAATHVQHVQAIHLAHNPEHLGVLRQRCLILKQRVVLRRDRVVRDPHPCRTHAFG